MPFYIRKAPRKDLYWVVKEDGKHMSKDPIPRERAEAQRRALYASENKNVEGSGFFSDIYDYGKKVVGRVRDVTRGVRRDYPPKVRQLLGVVGNAPIVQIYVRRDPIRGPLNTVLNLLTLGKWNEVKQKYAYDRVFHLGLEVVIQTNPASPIRSRYVIEKNEVINVAPANAMTEETEIIYIPLSGVTTINQLLQGSQRLQGGKFFLYDAFTNNCQDFIESILLGSELATPDIVAFVKQPMEGVVADLPSYIAPVARTATDIAALADVAFQGQGIPSQYVENLTFAQKKRQTALINKSKKEYEETGTVSDRPKVSDKPTKRSNHVIRFENKYGFPITDRKKLELTFPDTDINTILSKGIGAYASSGSRPNVSATQWANARLASVLTGGPSLRIDKDLVGKISMKKIKAKYEGKGIVGSFQEQLSSIGITPEAYLKEAKRRAKKAGLLYQNLRFADNNKHKLTISNEEGQERHFGRIGYGDHIIYTYLEAIKKVPSGEAMMRRNRFRSSHEKIKGHWKKDKYSPNNLALSVLW